jgi:microcystin degradation protein MlrC
MYEGDDLFGPNRVKGGTIDAICDVANKEGIELIPTIYAFGNAGPAVADATYEYLKERLLQGVRTHRRELAGVILPLHGAMSTESLDDPEGDLIKSVREIVGPDVPIVVSLDMHAHMTALSTDYVDGITSLQTHPHVDMYSNGARAMHLLARAIKGDAKPVVAQRKIRMMSSAETHNTTVGPMSQVMQRALAMEKEPGILATAIFATQPWMDVRELGWSTVVVADGDRALAQAKADELAMMCWERRERFLVHKTPIKEAVQKVLASESQPWVLADSSDSVTGGSNGDGNLLLKTLLEMNYADSALMTLTDPEAAIACFTAGVGATVTLPVGGKLTPGFYSPITVTGTVNTLWNGKYTSSLTPMPVDIGRTAVLQVGGIHILLSEYKAATIDAEAYRGGGLEPKNFKIVQVKSPGGFRVIYGPFAAGILELEAVGPCDSELPRLPFKRIWRPLWPWDKNLEKPW